MARIKGIELPSEKRTVIGLTYIHGIGKSLATTICRDAKVNTDTKVKDLTRDEEAKLRTEVDKYLTEGDLRRKVNMDIKTKKEIGSYEGMRHRKGLPVRGQKTRTNARNCPAHKGPRRVVANKKKAS